MKKHKTLVNYLHSHPFKIEPGFRSRKKEFSFGRGRIDIVGLDRNGDICLVEVKTHDKEILLGKRQIAKYQSQLADFLGLIGVERLIRGIIVTPTKAIDVGPRKSFVAQPKVKIPLDAPTSREIFGLRSGTYEKELIRIER